MKRGLKKGILFAVAVSGVAVAWAYAARYQLAGWVFLPYDGIRPAEYRVCAEHGVAMTTSDGVALVADVYRPCGIEKTATILMRIPFSQGLKNELGSGALATYWAARGYNVVVQGSRGR